MNIDLFKTEYNAPIGTLTLVGNGEFLTGVYFGKPVKFDNLPQNSEMFDETEKWLDIYFSGKEPDFMPKIYTCGSVFQESVWKILRNIEYGKLTTYGEIAKKMETSNGKRVSAQAVGGAVGHNPISILIPCHRVIGANGNLTGFSGGMENKIRLLEIEGVDMKKLYYKS